MTEMSKTKLKRIVISLPEKVLKDVNWLAPLEEMTRDELVLKAINRFLKPHLEIRKQLRKSAKESKKEKIHGPFDTADEMIAHLNDRIYKSPKITRAISEDTQDFKTSRYEP